MRGSQSTELQGGVTRRNTPRGASSQMLKSRWGRAEIKSRRDQCHIRVFARAPRVSLEKWFRPARPGSGNFPPNERRASWFVGHTARASTPRCATPGPTPTPHSHTGQWSGPRRRPVHSTQTRARPAMASTPRPDGRLFPRILAPAVLNFANFWRAPLVIPPGSNKAPFLLTNLSSRDLGSSQASTASTAHTAEHTQNHPFKTSSFLSAPAPDHHGDGSRAIGAEAPWEEEEPRDHAHQGQHRRAGVVLLTSLPLGSIVHRQRGGDVPAPWGRRARFVVFRVSEYLHMYKPHTTPGRAARRNAPRRRPACCLSRAAVSTTVG